MRYLLAGVANRIDTLPKRVVMFRPSVESRTSRNAGNDELGQNDTSVQVGNKTDLRHGVEISVAHRGCPWENGYAERLIRTLKEEEVHLNDYDDISQARTRIGHFIEQVYHQKRPHSALGYLTPIEFQRQNLS